MKWKDRLKKKSTWIIAICLIGVLAFTGRSLAAYTSQAFQRGVARNRDSETVRFTSNYLQNCVSGTTNFAGRTILFNEEKDEEKILTIDLYVYNYANGNVNLVSERDITYSMTITFSGGKGKGYDVKSEDEVEFSKEKSDTEFTCTDRTLTGRSANSHRYILTFPASDLDTLKITVEAIPTNLSVTNNQILGGVLAPCTGASTNDFKPEGKFTDTSLDDPSQYDGFNYEISISSGKADATLSWKPGIVEIDKFFLKKIGKTDTEIDDILEIGKVEFKMDLSAGSGDYLIPFYITNKSNVPKTWDDMEKAITFEATEIEETD